MKYTTLGIMMHNTCNAACDICSVKCSPNGKKELNVDKLKEFIESCRGTGIKNVSFTGGEPFIRYDALRELISYAHERELVPSVVTNGFWAVDDNEAWAKLIELKRTGLERINISYDSHHAKFVSAENINRIIKACEKIGLPYIVAATKLRNEKVASVIDEFDPDIICLNLMISNCQPVGNAKESYREEEFSKPIRASHMSCPYDGVITICFDGKIYPCCSHYVFETNLSIGQYDKTSMPEVLYRIKNNRLLYILRNFGMDPFLDSKGVKNETDEYVSSPCEFCRRLFSANLEPYLEATTAFLRKKGIVDE